MSHSPWFLPGLSSLFGARPPDPQVRAGDGEGEAQPEAPSTVLSVSGATVHVVSPRAPLGERAEMARARAPDGGYVIVPYSNPDTQDSAAYAEYNFGGETPMKIDEDSLPWIASNIDQRARRSGIVLSPGPSAIEFLQLQRFADGRILMGEFARPHREYQTQVTFANPDPNHPIWGKFQPLTGGYLTGQPQPEVVFLDLWHPPPELDGQFAFGACYSVICSVPPDEVGFNRLELNAMRPIRIHGVMAFQFMAKSDVWDDKAGHEYPAANVRYFRMVEGARLIHRYVSHKLVLSEPNENHAPYEGLAAMVLEKTPDYDEAKVDARMAQLRLRPEALRADGVPLLPRQFVDRIALYRCDPAVPLGWSPVGDEVLMLRPGANGASQLHRARFVDGAQPRIDMECLTAFDDGVVDARFVPDGSGRIVMASESGSVMLLDPEQSKYYDLTHGPGFRGLAGVSPAADRVLVTRELSDGTMFDIIPLDGPARRTSVHMGSGDWMQRTAWGSGLAAAHREGTGVRSVAWMPDGSALIAAERRAPDRARVWRVDAETGAKTPLLADEVEGRAVTYDNLTVTPDGAGFYCTTNRDSGRLRLAYYDFAAGTLEYLERAGHEALPPDHVEEMALSSDGRMLAAVTRLGAAVGGRSALQVFDLQAGTARLVCDRLGTNAARPCWHPDGRSLVYAEVSAEHGSVLHAVDVTQAHAAPRPWLDSNPVRGHVTPELISWAGASGEPMSAWLYRPPETARRGAHPVYVDLGPGGPEHLGGLRYLTEASGIAVMKINVDPVHALSPAQAVRALHGAHQVIAGQPGLDAGAIVVAGRYALEWACALEDVRGVILHADRETLERWLPALDDVLQAKPLEAPVLVFAGADDIDLARPLVERLRKHGVTVSYVDGAYEGSGRFQHPRNAAYADVLTGAFVDELRLHGHFRVRRGDAAFGESHDTDAFSIIDNDESEGVSFGSSVHGHEKRDAGAGAEAADEPAFVDTVVQTRVRTFGTREDELRMPAAALPVAASPAPFPYIHDRGTDDMYRVEPGQSGLDTSTQCTRAGNRITAFSFHKRLSTVTTRETATLRVDIAVDELAATATVAGAFAGRHADDPGKFATFLAIALQHTYFERLDIACIAGVDELREDAYDRGRIPAQEARELIRLLLEERRGIPASAYEVGTLQEGAGMRWAGLISVTVEPWAASGRARPR